MQNESVCNVNYSFVYENANLIFNLCYFIPILGFSKNISKPFFVPERYCFNLYRHLKIWVAVSEEEFVKDQKTTPKLDQVMSEFQKVTCPLKKVYSSLSSYI